MPNLLTNDMSPTPEIHAIRLRLLPATEAVMVLLSSVGVVGVLGEITDV